MRGYEKHQATKTAEWKTWARIRSYARCNGIEFSERWNSFRTFLRSMGKKPGKDYRLERKDLDDGYNEENCAWVHVARRGGRTAGGRYFQAYRQKRAVSKMTHGIK